MGVIHRPRFGADVEVTLDPIGDAQTQEPDELVALVNPADDLDLLADAAGPHTPEGR